MAPGGGRIWLLPYDVVPSRSTLSVCFVLNVCTGMSIFHEKAMSKLLIGRYTLLFVTVHELFIFTSAYSCIYHCKWQLHSWYQVLL